MNSERSYESFYFNFDIAFQKSVKILSITISTKSKKLMILNYFTGFTVKQEEKKKSHYFSFLTSFFLIFNINCSRFFHPAYISLHLKSRYKLVFK